MLDLATIRLNNGSTLLHSAAADGHLEVVDRLLDVRHIVLTISGLTVPNALGLFGVGPLPAIYVAHASLLSGFGALAEEVDIGFRMKLFRRAERLLGQRLAKTC